VAGVLQAEAYKVFKKNHRRAQVFIEFFEGSGRPRGRPSANELELLRGAVVFAVSALDAFLHDLILEIIPTFGGETAALREALREIGKSDPGLALRVILAPDKEAEFRAALDDWLSTKSFQGVTQVNKAVAYLGLQEPWARVEEWTGRSAKSRLEHFTQMRHRIIHRGYKPQLKKEDAVECVDLVEKIAQEIDGQIVFKYIL
jgi:hypothetical protein